MIIFTAFQKLVREAQAHDDQFLKPDDKLVAMRKLAIDYVNFIKECWVHTSQPLPRAEPLQFSSGHYRSLYTCFSLFVVLYLPEPGYEDVPIGEELMEWLNIHFIEPSTEDGDQLSALDNPWEDEAFWPYLTRAILRGLRKAAVFFLDALSRHPSEALHPLSKRLIPIIETQPFLQQFSSERDFAHASHRWKEKVKELRIEMDFVPEDDRSDDFDNWWARMSDIVGILEGRESVVQRVCEDLDADWKEVCAAWGIFLDTRLRRQDLPYIVAQAVEALPPDPTNLEDMIHISLLSDKLEQALDYATQLDPWLAAHLADIMEGLSLIETNPDESFSADVSIRDYYVLSYADSLHADASLWRLTVDYMYSCGDVGRSRADEILLRVPLRLDLETQASTSQAGDVVGVLKEINETCLEHHREDVRRSACRVAARSLVDRKHYGLALAYYTSAEDWVGVGYVADRVLQEFWTSGPSGFIKLAEDVSSAIQPVAQSEAPRVFVHHLIFAVRYARFQQLRMKAASREALSDLVSMFQEEVAPKSWWPVLLTDALSITRGDISAVLPVQGAITLLTKLNEITVRSQQGSTQDYMAILIKSFGGDEKKAFDQLQCMDCTQSTCAVSRCHNLEQHDCAETCLPRLQPTRYLVNAYEDVVCDRCVYDKIVASGKVPPPDST
ncbi:hypothetical protein ONZ45_g2879 [Pleurotus djamor]|nr:hypothetical protein ONZ45_g2879 [Pleurotus djamor]